MKKLTKKLTILILSSLVGVLTLISAASAASACSWVLYEPELPSRLRGE